MIKTLQLRFVAFPVYGLDLLFLCVHFEIHRCTTRSSHAHSLLNCHYNPTMNLSNRRTNSVHSEQWDSWEPFQHEGIHPFVPSLWNRWNWEQNTAHSEWPVPSQNVSLRSVATFRISPMEYARVVGCGRCTETTLNLPRLVIDLVARRVLLRGSLVCWGRGRRNRAKSHCATLSFPVEPVINRQWQRRPVSE